MKLKSDIPTMTAPNIRLISCKFFVRQSIAAETNAKKPIVHATAKAPCRSNDRQVKNPAIKPIAMKNALSRVIISKVILIQSFYVSIILQDIPRLYLP